MFLIEEHACHQEIFTDRKKILFLANVIAFSNLENTYDYTARTMRTIAQKLLEKIYYEGRFSIFRACD